MTRFAQLMGADFALEAGEGGRGLQASVRFQGAPGLTRADGPN